LTIFLQNLDELITFKMGRNGTVTFNRSGLTGKVMKRSGKQRGQPAGRLEVVPCENGTNSKRSHDRAAKKQALIRAALGLFASKGYEVTTTREIAASAGCAEGLIHRYFSGKAGLLAAMIEHRVSKEVLESIDNLRPAPNLEDEFLQLVNREVERVWESRDFLRVFIPRAIVDPDVGAAMNKALISVRAKAILTRLKRHQSHVTTLPQETMEALAQAVGMLGLVFGFVRPVLLGQDRLRAKKMAATVAKMFLASPLYPLAA
jgi:TetR/AcrR family transcriptional regulator, regulator of cefoperazone and chloramphenicol sensitivity